MLDIPLKLAREGLLKLLEYYPDAMIVKYDSQVYDKQEPGYFDYGGPPPGDRGGWTPRPDGPWICVDLTNGERFAIWKVTGNVYRVDKHGAAEDEPMITVTQL